MTGIVLLCAAVLFGGCKKKADDPIVPAFTVSATTVNLDNGGLGLQFTAKCTNDDIKLT